MKKQTPALLLLAMVASISCSSSDPDKRSEPTLSDKVPVAQNEKAEPKPEKMVFEGPGLLLPKEISGWTISSEPRYFGPDNLYDLINGGAEIYVQYGLKKMVTAEYKSEEKDLSITAEAYDMGTPEGAFGRLSRFLEAKLDPSDAGKGLEGDLAAHSIMGSGDLLTWKGRHLIHLTLLDESPTATPESIEKRGRTHLPVIAEAMLKRTKGDSRLPEVFTLFPEGGLMNRSHAWHPGDLAGIEGLGAGFLARYKDGEKTWTVFATEELADEAAAQAAWKSVKTADEEKRRLAIVAAKKRVVGLRQDGDAPLGDELVDKLAAELKERFTAK